MQVASGVEEKTAVGLKKMWPQIRLAASELKIALPEDPTAHITYPENATDAQKQSMQNDVWMQISRDLIDSKEPRKIIVIDKDGNPVEVPLSELDKLLTDKMKHSMGVDSIDRMVPTREQVDLISGSVASSVRESSGTGIGFLDNMLGGASLGDVFMGLMSWIFSGFEGGFTGLKETIADRTGARMEQSVVGDLRGLKRSLNGTEHDISGFMSEEAIRGVGAAVGDAPRASLSGASPKAGDALTDVKMGEFEGDMRAVVANKIEQNIAAQMETAFKNNAKLKELYASDSYIDAAKNAVGFSEKHRKLDALEKVRDGVSKKVATLITDPEYVYEGDEQNLASVKGMALRDMSEEKRALVLADETRSVIQQLGAASKDAGENIESFYALLEQTVPAEIQGGILAQDKKGAIPWFIAGEIGNVVRSDASAPEAAADEALTLTSDPEVEALAAQELVRDLQQQMKDALYPGGVASAEAKKIAMVAGAPLSDRHLNVLAEALAPAMLGLSTAQSIKDAMASGNEDAQSQALAEVSKTFSDALKAKLTELNDPADPANPDAPRVALSEEAVDVLAMRMAETYAREQLGMKEVPAEFAAKMQTQENAIAQAMVSQGLRNKLFEPATQNLLTTANDGTAIHVGNAVKAVEGIYAERLRDSEAMAKMGDTEYRQMFDDARSALEAKRSQIGVIDGARGDALLDSMAYQMTTGVVDQALGDRAPEVPARLAETKRVAEAALAEVVIPEMVRQQLVPLLDGTVSADDQTLDTTNSTIANVIAIDAARSGRQVNTKAVVENVSQVLLYHKLQHDKYGVPIDAAEMKLQMLGALYDARTGLGEQTAQQLAGVLTEQGTKAIEQPDAPAKSDKAVAQERKEIAETMLKELKIATYSQVYEGIGDDLGGDSKRQAAQLAATAMSDIALGKATRPIKGKDLQFHQINDEGQRNLVLSHVDDVVTNGLSGVNWPVNLRLHGWKYLAGDKISAAMATALVPKRDGDARDLQVAGAREAITSFETLKADVSGLSSQAGKQTLAELVRKEREQLQRESRAEAAPSAASNSATPENMKSVNAGEPTVASIPAEMQSAVSAFRKGPMISAMPHSIGVMHERRVGQAPIAGDPVAPKTPDAKSEKEAPQGMKKPEAGHSQA